MTDHACPSCTGVFRTIVALETHYSRQHDGVLLTQACVECGRDFGAEYAKRYCSRDCVEDHTSKYGETKESNQRGGKTTGTCQLCETEFEYYPCNKKGLYCPACVENEPWRTPPRAVGAANPRWKGGKQIVECVVCDSVVERYPSNIGKVTVCSESCRATWLSESFTGSGHPNWKGGGNPDYGPGWNAIRRRALERDGYQCVVCESTRSELGRNPDVHHIIPVREFITSEGASREDAHFLENVISLCIGCHRKAEFEKIPREELWALIGVTEVNLE